MGFGKFDAQATGGGKFMFDLKQKIEAWRDEQLKHNALSYADVAELQAHLEFSIDDLAAVGLSEEEAFYVAKHRLGDPHALIDEYGKVNPAPIWRKRFLWLVSGYFLLGQSQLWSMS